MQVARDEILLRRTRESAGQAGQCSTPGRNRMSARVQMHLLSWDGAMGRLNETGAGGPSLRGALSLNSVQVVDLKYWPVHRKG